MGYESQRAKQMLREHLLQHNTIQSMEGMPQPWPGQDVPAAVLVEDILARLDRNPEAPGHRESLLEAALLLAQAEPDHGECCAQAVLRHAEDWLDSARGGDTHTGRLYDLLRRALLFLAPTDFDAYMLYLEFDRPPERRYYAPRRQVLLPLAKAMEALCDGDLTLLAVSMPPGTGKTAMAIFFLTWVMGRFPDEPSLASGYSSYLTRSLYEGVLAVLTDREQYNWSDVFPNIPHIEPSAGNTSIHLGESSRFKTFTARSVGASLTGATRCERLLYADDLVEGIETALSPRRLDKLWQQYTDNLRSRKKDGCRELHVATRWSIHDPIGRLKQLHENDPQAQFIVVSALDKDGRSNFQYGHGVGFSTGYYLDMRETMDDASFQALFMNRPVERKGQLFSEGELRRYRALPEGEPDAIVAVCDTATGGGDDTFLPVGALYGRDCYILDCICDDGRPETTDPLCAALLMRMQVQLCRFESNAAGGRTADKVAELIQMEGGETRVEKRYTTANKTTKIYVHSAYIKERFLFRAKGDYTHHSHYGRMLQKLCAYSTTAKNPQDDVPDGLAQLAELLLSMGRGCETVALAVPRRY